PNGYSLAHINGAWIPVQATPQRRDGASALGPDCFAGPPPGDFAVTEVMFRCPSGLASGQFIEIGTIGATRTMTSDVGLRYFDRLGNLLAELPGAFGSGIGRDLNLAQAWLLAPQGSTTLGTPDGTFGVPMDTTGGRVVLYRARA